MARKQKPIERARVLRRGDVPAEARLWGVLRNRVLAGFKFRRQHPIRSYVVDFACVACKIVVEVDGATHLGRRPADDRRTRALESAGWQVLRFWNTEVYDELEVVTEAIYQACARRTSEVGPGGPLTPDPSPPATPVRRGRHSLQAGGEGSRRPGARSERRVTSASWT